MRALKKVIACMKELGRTPKVDSFEDRLVIQKATCLLQFLGFGIGYSFSLYIKGPYSPLLTSEIYENRDEVEGLKTDYVLSQQEKEMVAKVLEASNNLEPAMLEIIATYEYFVKNGRTSREALMETKRLKPFPDAKIAVAVSRAKQLFPPSQAEVQRMKAEFAEMEEAALADAKF